MVEQNATAVGTASQVGGRPASTLVCDRCDTILRAATTVELALLIIDEDWLLTPPFILCGHCR